MNSAVPVGASTFDVTRHPGRVSDVLVVETDTPPPRERSNPPNAIQRAGDLDGDEEGVHELFSVVRTYVVSVSKAFSLRVRAGVRRANRGEQVSLFTLLGSTLAQTMNLAASALRRDGPAPGGPGRGGKEDDDD